MSAYAVLALVCVSLAGLWWVSYGRNSSLIASVHNLRRRLQEEIRSAGRRNQDRGSRLRPRAAGAPRARQHAGRICPEQRSDARDRDLRPEPAPAPELGGQVDLRNRAVPASCPRLMYRIEERMRDSITNPSFLIGAPPVYLMMGGVVPMDRQRGPPMVARGLVGHLFRAWPTRPAAGAAGPSDQSRGARSAERPASLDIDRTLVRKRKGRSPASALPIAPSSCLVQVAP